MSAEELAGSVHAVDTLPLRAVAQRPSQANSGRGRRGDRVQARALRQQPIDIARTLCGQQPRQPSVVVWPKRWRWLVARGLRAFRSAEVHGLTVHASAEFGFGNE